jgi:DNA polymerase III epsilon subunit-like protein
MPIHAMIDLETLGTNPSAVVLTIGGVKFDPNKISDTYSEFYYRFDVDEQTTMGRTIDDATLEWWSKQEASVVEEALGDHNRTSVQEVMSALNKWSVGVDAFWCQGASFDIPILENMFRQLDHHIPWAFWKVRDSRTLFQIMPTDPRKEIEFEAHNALEDAKVQALCVQRTLQQLTLTVK